MMTPRATVVGSYGVGMWMEAPRVPAKGETLIGSGFMAGPGGKGSNQAIGVARLGLPVQLLACIGTDVLGDEAMALWAQESVDASAVVRSSDSPTMVGFIILDAEGDNRILIDPGANSLLTAEHVTTFTPAIQDSQILLTQLEIPVPTVGAALRIGREAGVTTVLNPAPAQHLPSEILAMIDILTPNQTELRILQGLPPDDPTPDEELAQHLLDSGVRNFVRRWTLGWLFAKRARLHLLGRLLRVFQRSGLQTLVRKSGLLKLLPWGLGELELLTPQIDAHFTEELYRRDLQWENPPQPRYRVALLAGCIQDIAFAQVNADTIAVLQQNGCEVAEASI